MRTSWLKTTVLFGLAFFALVAAGIAYSGAGSGDQSSRSSVYGGGRFGPGCFDENGQVTFCIPVGKAFSLDAEGGHHSVARGSLAYQRFAVRAAVTCMTVEGNRAAVGGLSFADANGSLVPPVPFIIYFIDNGPPAGSTRDRVSSIVSFGPGESFPGEPSNFPHACPASASAYPGLGYMDLNAPDGQAGGDIVVRAGEGHAWGEEGAPR